MPSNEQMNDATGGPTVQYHRDDVQYSSTNVM